MHKGAIDTALSNRAARESKDKAIARHETALAKLKELNVEMDEKCPANEFYNFAMNVLENLNLQGALSAAKEYAIRVVVTNRESCVEGEDIFINGASTTLDAINFLRGD